MDFTIRLQGPFLPALYRPWGLLLHIASIPWATVNLMTMLLFLSHYPCATAHEYSCYWVYNFATWSINYWNYSWFLGPQSCQAILPWSSNSSLLRPRGMLISTFGPSSTVTPAFLQGWDAPLNLCPSNQTAAGTSCQCKVLAYISPHPHEKLWCWEDKTEQWLPAMTSA